MIVDKEDEVINMSVINMATGATKRLTLTGSILMQQVMKIRICPIENRFSLSQYMCDTFLITCVCMYIPSCAYPCVFACMCSTH